MKTATRISSTFVRHNWKSVAKGIATGKTYVVENHGVPEAVVTSPGTLVTSGEDVDAYFKGVMKRRPVPLARVEVTRGTEV